MNINVKIKINIIHKYKKTHEKKGKKMSDNN